MTAQTQKPTGQNGNAPDYVLKAPANRGNTSRLERIGVGWARENGGITLRLTGKQVIDADIYLYPINGDATGEAQ